MRGIISILLLFSAFNFNVYASKKSDDKLSSMTFGLEWGYISSIHTAYSYSFMAPEGYRVAESENSFGFISNAGMYFNIGYELNPMWNISMYIGYEGIADLHKAIPISLRMTRYFNPDRTVDRWFSFLDLGSGISIKSPVQEILSGKIGAGYRLSLGRYAALSFLMSARLSYTHPEVLYDKTAIVFEKYDINHAFISALSVGMAISF